MQKNKDIRDSDRVDTAELLSRVDIVDVIDGYVPLAKSGAEYEACCPFHTESTPSFKVSPAKQFYNCFGCGANGDAIKFLQEYSGLSFLDACRELGADVAAPAAPASGAAAPREPVQRAPIREKQESPWTPIMPAPTNAPPPPRAHVKRGLPERVWCYRAADGAVLGYVYRFKTSTGGKAVLPLTWCRCDDTGEVAWHWMAMPEPRPLYGLDELAARPDDAVLLVEGEKCKDVGTEQLPGLVVVSWPGGGKAVRKVDWSPLFGRKVLTMADCDAKRTPLTPAEVEAIVDDGRLAGMPAGKARTALVKALSERHQAALAEAQAAKPLLPEADQPGVKTMAQIAAILLENGSKVWNVKIPAPGEKPDGWDIADAVDEGLVGEVLADFIRSNSSLLAAASEGVEMPSGGAGKGASTPSPAGASDGSSGDGSNAWRRELLRKDDRLIDCRENVYLMLRNHPAWKGVLWADEFARKIVKRKPTPWESEADFVPGAKWDEDDDLRLGLWLAQSERLLIRSADTLAASVGWVARESRWHPVRDYLDSLVWDGVSRLGDWLTDYLGVKKVEYTILSGRLFLISMVARIYKPGCQMRAMPILEGVQFRGKSTALRILGGEWYGDTPLDLNSKDTYQLIQGRWLYEVAELDAFNKADATRIKAFISSQEDRFRAPYDRAPREWPRSTVFCGTTNQDEYFKDPTGNTRYWPWRVEEVDQVNLDGLAAARDQLFAEAVVLFRQGERWHPTREEQERLFEPEQSDREIADPWQAQITKFLRSRAIQRVTANEIFDDCLKIEAGKIDSARQMSTRVGIAMKRIGWIKKRETGGDREYYYVRPAGWGESRGSDVPF